MKLQSHIDYENTLDFRFLSDADFRLKSKNHRIFQSLSLELGMFIPTDENGNVFNEDGTDGDGYVLDKIMYDEFQQAKDRVIFEGFEIKTRKCVDKEFEYIDNGLLALFYFNNTEFMFLPNTDYQTIEDLVKYNLTITETAVKKYGL